MATTPNQTDNLVLKSSLYLLLANMTKRQGDLTNYLLTLGLPKQDLEELAALVTQQVDTALEQESQITKKIESLDARIAIATNDEYLAKYGYDFLVLQRQTKVAEKENINQSIKNIGNQKQEVSRILDAEILGINNTIDKIKQDLVGLQSQILDPAVNRAKKEALKKQSNGLLIDLQTKQDLLKVKSLDRQQKIDLFDRQVTLLTGQLESVNAQIVDQQLAIDQSLQKLNAKSSALGLLKVTRDSLQADLIALQKTAGNLLTEKPVILIGSPVVDKDLKQQQSLLTQQEMGTNQERSYALKFQLDKIGEIEYLKSKNPKQDHYVTLVDKFTEQTKDLSAIWQGNLAESVKYTQTSNIQLLQLSQAREKLNNNVEKTLADLDGVYRLAETELNEAIALQDNFAKRYASLGQINSSLKRLSDLWDFQMQKAEEMNRMTAPYSTISSYIQELSVIEAIDRQLLTYKKSKLADPQPADFKNIDNLLKASGKTSNIQAQYNTLVQPYLDILDGKNALLASTAYLNSPATASFDIKNAYTPAVGYAISNNNYKYLTGDFNGDGKTDLIHFIADGHGYTRTWLSKGDGTFDLRPQYTPAVGYGIGNNNYKYLTGDFNGDGKTDLIHLVADGSGYIRTWLAKGDGTFDLKPAYRPWLGYDTANNNYKYLTGDFNGDGKTDLIHLFDANGGYAHVWLAKADGTFDVKPGFTPWHQPTGVPADYLVSSNSYNFQTGDFNGDGKTDLIHLANSKYALLWLSKGDGTFETRSFTPWSGYDVSNNGYKYLTGDFNGDGKTDLIHLLNLNNGYAHVWLSKGDGTFDVKTGFTPWSNPEVVPADYSVGANNYNYQTGDFNGDGKTDLVHYVNDRYALVWTSNGNGTFNVSTPSPNNGYSMSSNNYNFQKGDFNGDGKTDLLHLVNNSYVQYWQSLGESQAAQKNRADIQIKESKQKTTQDLLALINPLIESVDPIIKERRQQLLTTLGNQLTTDITQAAGADEQSVLRKYTNFRSAAINQNSDRELANFDAQLAKIKKVRDYLTLQGGQAKVAFSAKTGSYYFLTSATSWHIAQSEAASIEGHLVTVNNAEEQDFLVRTFGTSQHFWIGLNDEKQEGKWEWVNGESVSYTNFAPGEPNNAGNEDYVHLSKHAGGQWNDLADDGRSYYNDHDGRSIRGIVELNVPDISKLLGLDTLLGVDKLIYNYKTNRYYGATSLTTWHNAQAEAAKVGGNLVTVNDAEEQDFLVKAFGASEHFWIGLNDEKQEGKWEWVNGESVAYTNFAPGQPDNANNEDYVHLSKYAGGQWNDLPDDERSYHSDHNGRSIRGIIEFEAKTIDDLIARKREDIQRQKVTDLYNLKLDLSQVTVSTETTKKFLDEYQAIQNSIIPATIFSNLKNNLTSGFTATAGWLSDNVTPRRFADVNGDGKADMVGFGADKIHISLSNGDGTFGPLYSSGVGFIWPSQNQYPRYFADANGDGKADIIGFEVEGVWVSINKGDGTFQPAFSQNIGFTPNIGGWSNQSQFPRYLADVNGDGRADIIGFANDYEWVSLAQPNGSFGSAFWQNLGFTAGFGWPNSDTTPRYLADVNGDGKADIVGLIGDKVFVAFAQKDGLFSKAVSQTLTYTNQVSGWTNQNLFPRQLADINGDGKADIIGFGSDQIFVFLAGNNGIFSSAQPISLDFTTKNGFQTQDATPRQLADVNGDGRADIIGFSKEAIKVSLNSVNGFGQVNSIVTGRFTASSNWLSDSRMPRRLADVNGDGKADIIGFSNDLLYISLSNGDQTFAPAYTSDIGFTAAAREGGYWTGTNDENPRQLADLNGDGKADIIGFGGGRTWVSLNKGDGTFNKIFGQDIANASFVIDGGWVSQDAFPRLVGDVNGDGKADIVGFADATVIVSLNKGDGYFAAGVFQNLGFNRAAGWASNDTTPRYLADVNGDGKVDIVGLATDKVWISLAQNDGIFGVAFSQTLPFTIQNGGWTQQNNLLRQLADVDGDGKADIVGFGDNKIHVALAQGNGVFGETQSFSFDFTSKNGWDSQDVTPRQLADINGDGAADIVGFGKDGIKVAIGYLSKELQVKKIREKYFPGSTNNVDLPALQEQIITQQTQHEQQKQEIIKNINQQQALANAAITQAKWYTDQSAIHWERSRKQGPTWTEQRRYRQRSVFGRKWKTIDVVHVDHDWIIWDAFTSQAANFRDRATDALNQVTASNQQKDVVSALLLAWDNAFKSAQDAVITKSEFETYIKKLETDKTTFLDNKNNILNLKDALPIVEQELATAKIALEQANQKLTQEQDEYVISKNQYQAALENVLTEKSAVDLSTQQTKLDLAAAERWADQELVGLAEEIQAATANKQGFQAQIDTLKAQLAIATTEQKTELKAKQLLLEQALQLTTYEESILIREKTDFTQKKALIQSQRAVIESEEKLLDAYLQSPDNDYSNLEEELYKARTALLQFQDITKQARNSSEAILDPLKKLQSDLLLQQDNRLAAVKEQQKIFQDLLIATKLQANLTAEQGKQQQVLNALQSKVVDRLKEATQAGSAEAQKLLEQAQYNNWATVAEVYARDYRDLSTDQGSKCSSGIAKPEDRILADQYAQATWQYRDLESKAKDQAAQLKLVRESSEKQVALLKTQELSAKQDLELWSQKVAANQAEVEQKQLELNLSTVRIDVLGQMLEWTNLATNQLLAVEKLNYDQAKLVQSLVEQRQIGIDQTISDRLERERLEIDKQWKITVAQIEQLSQVAAENELEKAINELRVNLGLSTVSLVPNTDSQTQSLQELLQKLDSLKAEPKLPSDIQSLLTQTQQDINKVLQGQDIEIIQGNLLKTTDALLLQNERYQATLDDLRREETKYNSIYEQAQYDLQGATKKLLAEIEITGKLQSEETLLNQQNLENLYKLANGANAVTIATALGQQPRDLIEQIIGQRIQERVVRKKAFVNELLGVVSSALALVGTVLSFGSLAPLLPFAAGFTAAAGAVSAAQAAYNGDWAGAIFKLTTTLIGAAASSTSSQLATSKSLLSKATSTIERNSLQATIAGLEKSLAPYEILRVSANTIYGTYRAVKSGDATQVFLTAIDGIAQAVAASVPLNSNLSLFSKILNATTDLSKAVNGTINAFQDGDILKGLDYIAKAAGSISTNFADELKPGNLKALRVILHVTGKVDVAYKAFKSFEDGNWINAFKQTIEVLEPLTEVFKSSSTNQPGQPQTSPNLLTKVNGWSDTITANLKKIDAKIEALTGLNFNDWLKIGKTTNEVIQLFKQDDVKGWISGIQDILNIWKKDVDSGTFAIAGNVLSTASKIIDAYETGTLSGWLNGINDSLNIWQDEITSFVDERRQKSIAKINFDEASIDKIKDPAVKKLVQNNIDFLKKNRDAILALSNNPSTSKLEDLVSFNPRTNQMYLKVGTIQDQDPRLAPVPGITLGQGKTIKLYVPVTNLAEVPNLAVIKQQLAKSATDPAVNIKVIIPGLMNSISSSWSQDLAEATLKENPKSIVIIADWGDLSGKSIFDYNTSAKNAEKVGDVLAQQLKNLGVDFKKTTLIGYSLGAHVAANIGEYLQRPENGGQVVEKIVGLDPARPNFETSSLWFGSNSQNLENRLDGKDAKNVEIIHTSYNSLLFLGLGYARPGLNGTTDSFVPMEVRNLYPGIDHHDAIDIYTDYLNHKKEGQSFSEFLAQKQIEAKSTPTVPESASNYQIKIDLSQAEEISSFEDLRLEGAKIENVDYTWIYTKSQDQPLALPGVSPSQLSAANFIFKPSNVLRIDGTSSNDTLVGGLSNEIINGIAGDDYLKGGGGDDTINGGLGNDYLDGGSGRNNLNGGTGNDFYEVHDSSNDLVSENGNEGVDGVWAFTSYSLTNNVENLYLVDTSAVIGNGNSSNNIIIDYAGGNNFLNGRDGNDTIDGGAGADTIDGGADNDSISGGSGNDYLKGSSGNDTLDGGNGNDYLDGGSGLNNLNGGTGNDFYEVRDGNNDLISENANEGVDGVWAFASYSLTKNVENLYLVDSNATIGNGNSSNNIIIDYAGGNNTLDGAAGNDTVSGGTGNDYLKGGDGNDILNGEDGNDYLDGGAGINTLSGGAGNDFYEVRDGNNDLIFENTNEGVDGVWAFTSYSLTNNVENLYLVDPNATIGNGNSSDNNIIDYAGGNNIINGGSGNDYLFGGAGQDTFQFGNNALTISITSEIGIDTIGDFTSGQDKLFFSSNTFKLIADGNGFIQTNDFAVVANNAAAEVSTAKIVYISGSGSLFFNENGSNVGFGDKGGQFAILANQPITLRSSDIRIGDTFELGHLTQ